MVVPGWNRTSISHLPASTFTRFELVTPRRRRVTTKIDRLAGVSATAFARIPRLDARGIAATIAFRSVDYSNEREFHERMVTAGFALYY
jgi:hypothetical protein